MNQKYNKPFSQFTEKQREALKACLRAVSENQNFRSSKGNLVAAIRLSGAYTRKHDAIKTLKMFLKNPNVPLQLQEDFVIRTDMEGLVNG